ncbi:hypothetical protein pdam_00006102 [Pocillopora damicornis]|uniref:Uncharacterized protein n=1 Tax=Pocillopora damicornis TaxID=46731 RepID=A0A3M6TDP2_POCDA|nr:hypothetical protein pdam_00006102 [Pocillopora damicornis]
MIIPCLESTGGNCQDAAILVDEIVFTVKLLGGFDGAKIKQLTAGILVQQAHYFFSSPSSFVLSTTTELLGPSPTEVKANT